jgi:hypothetical protein
MPLRILRCLVVVLAAALGACAGQRDMIESSRAPTSYKADIVAFLRTYLNDPTNVRDAAASQPALQRFDGGQRYAVCVRFNARKSDGTYAGVIETAAIFNVSGKLDRFFDLTPDETAPDAAIRAQLRESCKTVAYQPFPELEHMTR